MGVPTIIVNDPWLSPYKNVIERRMDLANLKEAQLCKEKKLSDFATGHLYFGLHKEKDGWVFREWAPNATDIYLVGDFNEWKANKKYAFQKLQFGNWEIHLQEDDLKHGQYFQLLIKWKGGEGLRLPSYGNRMVQDPKTLLFAAQVWSPGKPYKWKK
jgi:1,4-alpha-glucan branching enzyme